MVKKATAPNPLEALRVKLRKAAEDSGLTQQQIGEAMGQNPDHARKVVSRLLSFNDYDPRYSTLLAFAQAINRRLTDLLP